APGLDILFRKLYCGEVRDTIPMKNSMDTIYDYIKWRGDERFSYRPFSETDAVIRCYLAYLDINDAMRASVRPSDPCTWRSDNRYKLRDICHSTKEKGGGYNILTISGGFGESPLIDAMAVSKRFGDLWISRLMEVYDEENSVQFSAITIALDNHSSFIAFRGTDDSLAGWKEDFMMSYTTVKAQELALSYARQQIEDILTNDERHVFYLGGHSKGGNLALYSAATLPMDMWQSVQHVYMLDSPGLCLDAAPQVDLDHIAGRTTHIRPEFSVIGSLFDTSIPDTKIVKSNAKKMMQHDLSSWGVRYGDLYYTEKLAPAAKKIDEGLDRWLEKASAEERTAFVTELFDAIAAEGILHFKDTSAIDRHSIQNIVLRVTNMSHDARATALSLPKELIKSMAKR
ncbi:MAG: DUF2974 domain-containing protein, partial [Lachnospiraceae bacterium]|nr:DUF2974 domain-containing protein [Lachnospiraceae bacterium]